MNSKPTPSALDMIAEERKFIHDLSTPLTTAQLLLDTCMESLSDKLQAEPSLTWIEAEVARLNRVLETVQSAGKKLQERRSKLIAASQSG